MIKSKAQLNFLKSVLANPLFAKSEIYKKLLMYLVQCSLKGVVASEIEIATEVLGKDHTFDPFEDTLVRVHIYKLRKKLEEYYHKDGKNDKIKLTIPKGHYHVVFESKSKEGRQKANLLKTVYLLIIIILISIIILQWYRNQASRNKTMAQSPIREASFIWSNFLNDDISTILAFGSLFAFNEYCADLNSYRLVRDDQIESVDDLENFIDRHSLNPDNYQQPSWDILSKSSLQYLSAIQPIFTLNDKPLTWKTSNQIQWEDLKKYNIVYIGHFYHLNHMKEFFPSLYFSKYTENVPRDSFRQIRFYNHTIDTTYTYVHPSSNASHYVRDYVIVSLVPGPQNNVFLFIVSFHQISRIEVLKFLVEPLLLNKLREDITAMHGPVPAYFEMLIEVEGYGETVLYTKIKHFYALSSEYLNVSRYH
ncbi:hypothetical protein JW835_13935 [bacterium]|nr:hypothetical protein [bacterium]